MTEENKKKKNKIFDKVIMGAIIGGAIGSVIGASVGGKKDQPIKEDPAEEPEKAKVVPRTIFRRILGIFRKKNGENQESVKKIPNEIEQYTKQ